MKHIIMVALALVVGASLSTAQAAKKDKKDKKKTAVVQPAVQLLTSSDSVSYAAGVSLAEYISKGALAGLREQLKDTPDSLNTERVYQGLADALHGDTTLFKADAADKLLNTRLTAARKAKEEKAKAEGQAFLDENAKKEGVTVLTSGLQYKVLTEGNGPVAKATDKVKVHYEGRLIDGTVFDSSYKRGQPTTFVPNQVIKGWTEALTLMPVGSKWQLYIPQDLAYGARGAGQQIPPYSTLIFDVEVLSIENEK